MEKNEGSHNLLACFMSLSPSAELIWEDSRRERGLPTLDITHRQEQPRNSFTTVQCCSKVHTSFGETKRQLPKPESELQMQLPLQVLQ